MLIYAITTTGKKRDHILNDLKKFLGSQIHWHVLWIQPRYTSKIWKVEVEAHPKTAFEAIPIKRKWHFDNNGGKRFSMAQLMIRQLK